MLVLCQISTLSLSLSPSKTSVKTSTLFVVVLSLLYIKIFHVFLASTLLLLGRVDALVKTSSFVVPILLFLAYCLSKLNVKRSVKFLKRANKLLFACCVVVVVIVVCKFLLSTVISSKFCLGSVFSVSSIIVVSVLIILGLATGSGSGSNSSLIWRTECEPAEPAERWQLSLQGERTLPSLLRPALYGTLL